MLLRTIHIGKSLFRVGRNLSTSIQVTEDQIRDYQENGAVCLRGVFSKKWLDLADLGIQINMKQPSPFHDWLENDQKQVFFNDYYNYNRIAEYTKYVMESPSAAIAGQLMQSNNSLLFHEHVFSKDGGSSKETPWHHDQAYYPLEGMQNCSIWMPTTPVARVNCVKFLRGSHRWGKYFHPRKFASNENYQVDEDAKDDKQEYADIATVTRDINPEHILGWDVQPGDCIAFHMKTIHGTEQSTVAEKRVVMVTRWLGDDATFSRRPWEVSPPKVLLPDNIQVGDLYSKFNHFTRVWTKENDVHT